VYSMNCVQMIKLSKVQSTLYTGHLAGPSGNSRATISLYLTTGSNPRLTLDGKEAGSGSNASKRRRVPGSVTLNACLNC
jgi:hypothetical protein